MTYEERQKFKALKQQMELSLYSRIIEHLMNKLGNYEKLPAKDRLEITVLVGKIRELDNKYNA